MKMLQGQVALVVGGARGLGRATALAFAREGANVALADVLAERVLETAAEVEATGVRALGAGCDVSDEAAVEMLVQRCLDEFGQIDIMVNTVAWIDTPDLIVDLSREIFEKTLLYDLTTHFLVAKHTVKAMLPRGYGRIVNISSMAGRRGSSMRVAYCAAKAGVISLSETLNAEYGDKGISVNALCPGGITGERLDALMKLYAQQRGEQYVPWEERPTAQRGPRAMTPEELAEYVLFLVQPETAHIRGQALSVQDVRELMDGLKSTVEAQT